MESRSDPTALLRLKVERMQGKCLYVVLHIATFSGWDMDPVALTTTARASMDAVGGSDAF